MDQKLKLVVLSRNRNLYSTKRLCEAAINRGHEVKILDHLRCFMDITSANPTIHYGSDEYAKYDVDAIIPRIGASVTFYGAAIVRQFEVMGVYSLNHSVAITRSRDKLRALQLMSQKGVGMPTTCFAHSGRDTIRLIREVGGPPLIIKLLEGTQGKGVVLAETKKAAESVIQAFMKLQANILVQEFVSEAKGVDVRCLVLGDKVIAAMERQGAPGDFRSNLHRGGSAKLTKLTSIERKTAIKAAQAMGLNLCGVDLLRSDNGPLVMEVNSSPGLRGIEEATGKDIADLIVTFIEKKRASKIKKTNG